MAMLRREDEVVLPPAVAGPAAPAVGIQGAQAKVSELNALLGKGSSFEGKLLFEGTVRIDG